METPPFNYKLQIINYKLGMGNEKLGIIDACRIIASPGGKLSAQLTEEEFGKTAWRFLLRWNLLLRNGEQVWTEQIDLRFRPHSSPGSASHPPPGGGYYRAVNTSGQNGSSYVSARVPLPALRATLPPGEGIDGAFWKGSLPYRGWSKILTIIVNCQLSIVNYSFSPLSTVWP